MLLPCLKFSSNFRKKSKLFIMTYMCLVISFHFFFYITPFAHHSLATPAIFFFSQSTSNLCLPQHLCIGFLASQSVITPDLWHGGFLLVIQVLIQCHCSEKPFHNSPPKVDLTPSYHHNDLGLFFHGIYCQLRRLFFLVCCLFLSSGM